MGRTSLPLSTSNNSYYSIPSISQLSNHNRHDSSCSESSNNSNNSSYAGSYVSNIPIFRNNNLNNPNYI
ncbi:hypothetical protein U3516DRAFT_892548 [Neocallimastix sp. 'constans']